MILSTIKEFFLKPFTENFPKLLCIWFLISVADIFFWVMLHDPKLGIILSIYGFIEAYIVVLFIGIFKKGIGQNIVYWVFSVLGIINMMVDAYVHYITHGNFWEDHVGIIMNTNPSEASEFLSTYLHPVLIIFIISSIVIFCLLHHYLPRVQFLRSGKIKYTLFITLILLASVIYIKQWTYGRSIYINKLLSFVTYEKAEPLGEYRTEPELKVEGNQPRKIVLVIGEALSRKHCSLYGYRLPTTPHMDSLAKDGSIIWMSSIVSPATTTTKCFDYIMSTCTNTETKKKAYEYPLLLDITDNAGYENVWISNQSSSGLADNLVARYAELADSLVWVGAKGMGSYKTDVDEIVLSPIEKIVADNDKQQFVIVHLMGSHENFWSRYPAGFTHFVADDYPNAKQNQKQTLADYDNSVRYTDYVLNRIIDLLKDEEAIMFFFPDHSMDIFDTDPEYAGHARPTEPESYRVGTEIPFIVYPSPSYAKHFPEEVEKLRNVRDEAFNTQDIVYRIMDVANVEFAEEQAQ